MMKKVLNPFRYLLLRQAICWGVVGLILITVFMWQCGLRATSLTQIDFGGGALWNVLVRQLIIWIMFSLVLFVGGVLGSKSKVRFCDVAAFNLFARLPFSLSLLIFAIPSVKTVMGYATDMNMSAMMEHMTTLLFISIATMVFCIWYFFWTYKAFAEATNVKNSKGVAIFFVCFMLSYVASISILKMIV